MERVGRARAVCRGIRERLDDLELLDDRARPPVRDDQQQCVLVLGAEVDEVDVKAVDLSDELRQRVEARRESREVVVVQPVAGEFLHDTQLNALRAIGDELLRRPARRRNPPAQIVDLLLGKLDVERPDRRCGLDGGAHDDLLLVETP